MIDALLAKIFGTQNEREIKAMMPTVAARVARVATMRPMAIAKGGRFRAAGHCHHQHDTVHSENLLNTWKESPTEKTCPQSPGAWG